MNSANTQKRTLLTIDWLLLLAIILFAAAVRWQGIDRQSLWADEAYALWLSLSPHFSDIFPNLLVDSHPPAYVSFMYFYAPLTDYSEIAIRMPSLLAGIGTVLLTYQFGARYISVSAGLIAACLVAGSYQMIFYSQEARVYTLLAFTCLASLYGFIRCYVEKDLSYAAILFFVFPSIVTCYLHYCGVVFFLCEEVILFFLLLADRRLIFFKACLCGGLLVALAFTPWMPVMYQHMTTIDGYWGDGHAINIDYLRSLYSFLFGPDDTRKIFTAIALLVSILTTLLCSQYYEKSKRTRFHISFIVVIMAALPIAVFYIKSQLSQPVFQERHFTIVIPLVMIVIGSAFSTILFERIHHPYLRYALLSLLLTALGVMQYKLNTEDGLYRIYVKDPMREAVQVVLHDSKFMQENPQAIYLSHQHFLPILKRYGLLSPDHYDGYRFLNASPSYAAVKQLTDNLTNNKVNSLYYLSIGPVVNYPLLQIMATHHRQACFRQFQTRSGTVTISKFMLLEPPVNSDAVGVCAPDLEFDFPVQ